MSNYIYPDIKKLDYVENYHGIQISDPYIWLEDAKSDEVIDWVKRQNTYTDNYFNQSNDINIQKIKEKIKGNITGLPYVEITKIDEAVFVTKRGTDNKIQMLVLNDTFEQIGEICKEYKFPDGYNVTGYKVNPQDKNLIVIEGMFADDAKATMFLFNNKTNEILHTFSNAFFSYWSNDGKTLYCTEVKIDKENAKNLNSLRALTIETMTEKTIFSFDKNAIWIECRFSSDDRFIFISVVRDYTRSDLYFIDNKSGEINCLASDEDGTFQYLGTINNKHYIQTNLDSPYGKIITIPTVKPSLEESLSIIENPNELMNSILTSSAFMVDDKIFVNYLDNVITTFRVYDICGNYLNTIDTPSKLGFMTSIGKSVNENNKELFFTFESFVDAPCVFKYNINSKLSTVIYKTKEINKKNVCVDQVFVESYDNEKIPAFIVYNKNIEMNGNTPTLIYGYGGYGLMEKPRFMNGFLGLQIVDWVNKGYTYVVCNLRGGGEYGVKWHKSGNLLNKKNAFYDHIAITQWLIDNNYTNPNKIAIAGTSNGGLLVSTLTTMRPDLYKAVVATVPHTDMLHFKKDATGPMYKTEYGDIENEEMFKYILSYSPYHNVKEVSYPSILIQTGEKDNNVPSYHGKKLAARLQELNQSDNPILLRVIENGGHNIAVGEDLLNARSEFLYFIYKELDIEPIY